MEMSESYKPRSLMEIINDVLSTVRDYYDAEYYADDYPDGLSEATLNITFLNQERECYYRLRGVFSAVYDNDYEGFSPTTSGIWID